MKTDRNVVALVSADDTAIHLREALENAGYEVPIGYARDLRGGTTAFSTFVETYKPEVIVLDLHPPADDAVKDILSFKAVRSASNSLFILVSSDAATHAELPDHAGVIRLTDASTDAVVRAVRDALAAKRAA